LPGQLTTLVVANTNNDNKAIKVNAESLNWKSISDSLTPYSSKLYMAKIGPQLLKIAQSSDTSKIIFQGSENLKTGCYSLFITGSPLTPDTLFRYENNLPFVIGDINIAKGVDSVVMVRFVNMISNSPKLKIQIANNTTPEVSESTYKSVSDWKAYSSKASGTTNYVFQIRNADTNTLLFSYTFGATNTNRYRNVTLVLKGQIGGTGATAPGIFAVNYF
jgi:hypothetical protein